MDRRHIHDTQLIERYLAGRLSAAEEQSFEEAYLADPRLLEESSSRSDCATVSRTSRAEQRAATRRARRLAVGSRLAALRHRRVVGRRGRARGRRRALLAEHGAQVRRGGAGRRECGARPVVSSLCAARATRTRSLRRLRRVDRAARSTPGFADYDSFSAALLRAGTDEALAAPGRPGRRRRVWSRSGWPVAPCPPGSYEIRLEGERTRFAGRRALDELSRTPLTVTPRP